VTDRVALRDVYGAALPEFGHRYPTLAVLDADLATSTRTAAFRKEFPDRHLNVGIAEQNMVGMAAGIALAGGMPAVNTFAAFLSRRAADQIAISVAYPNLNVKFFGFHAGISLGEDGATQQAVEDLGIMQAIPNIRVYAPLDAVDLRAVMEEVFSTSGPTYVRLARFPSPQVIDESKSRSTGYQALRPSTGRLVVVTTGTICADVLEAAEALAPAGIDLGVIGVTRIKPLDRSLAGALSGRHVAVVEEHNVHGGLADAVSNLLDAEGVEHRIERVGIPDRFGESGKPTDLLHSVGLSAEALTGTLRAWSQNPSMSQRRTQ
jgi:transketolase